MPNWVYNTLTIQGPKSEIDYIKDKLNAPFTLAIENHGMGDISAHGFPTKIKQVTYSNPVFAFFNIHSYKDDGITDEEYAQQPDRSGIDINNDPDWFAKSVERAKTAKDWYSWNNSNWGTKWDVAVSIKVSPFLIAEFDTFIFITSAPNLFPASSNELKVLVEDSKNKLI